ITLLWTMAADRSCATNCWPTLQKAADRTVEGFADSPSIIIPLMVLQFTHLEQVPAFLERLGNRSHNRRIRAAAWPALAENLGTKYEYPEQTARGAKWAERLAKEFGDVELNGAKIATRCQELAFQLNNLVYGRTPPNLEGKDEEGKPINLADTRGKVVLVSFWSDRFPQCREQYEKLR